jgi:hypothetical protein
MAAAQEISHFEIFSIWSINILYGNLSTALATAPARDGAERDPAAGPVQFSMDENGIAAAVAARGNSAA